LPTRAAARAAEAADLDDGIEVELYNDIGALRATAAISDDMLRGVVALPGKWWHPTSGHPGAVVNLLSRSDWSPGGQPAYIEVFVSVRRAK